jgi:hypothetical protein
MYIANEDPELVEGFSPLESEELEIVNYETTKNWRNRFKKDPHLEPGP